MVKIKKQPPTKSNSTRPVYYKTLTATDVTVDESSRTVSGYAAIWGNVDDAGDMLIKGCCAKSIADRGPGSKTNRKIVFLWQHDTDEPLGTPTMLIEDDKGLYFEAVVDQIPEGDRCLTQLKSGTLNQFSIGYMYVWDKCEWQEMPDPEEPGDMMGVLVVKEINLFEFSVVTFGCNEETGFEGMKSGQMESERNKLARDTEKALKSLPYDQQLQIKQLISKHIALAEYQPGKPTDTIPEPPAKKGVDFKQLLLN